MRVFISSVIVVMEAFRNAASASARLLRHEVIRAEDFSASPATPQQACLRGVREADLMVILLGARYGVAQASGLSATHEEYREAREHCPVIILVQEDVSREPTQDAFVAEVQEWSQGHYTATFRDAESLRDALTRTLHDLELAAATGPVQPEEMLDSARALIPRQSETHDARLVVATAGGPLQPILRPREIEDAKFADDVAQQATFGHHRVLDRSAGTKTRVVGHALVLEQPRASLYLDEQGSVRITLPARSNDPRNPAVGLALIEEDLLERIENGVRFTAELLDWIDPSQRLTHVAVAAAVLGGNYLGWQTRAEYARSPNSVSIPMGASERTTVWLSPPHRPRPALALNARQIAEDLTTLLRRARTGP